MHIITMLALLSVLILVHEFGHFIVARWLGIRVERFGFGLPFGPTLYETKWGETKICIHAFLLGGYVSFPDDDPESKIPKDSPERISNKSVWERFLVVSAGVIANAIIAYFIVLLVAGGSGGVPSGKYNVFIEGIQEGKDLPAQEIGVQSGDKVVSVNSIPVDTLFKFVETVQRSKRFNDFVSYGTYNSQLQKIQELNPDLPKEGVIPAGTMVKLPAASPEEPVDVPKDIFSGYQKYKPNGKYLNGEEKELRSSLENKQEYISDGNMTVQSLAAATGDTVHAMNIMVERNDELIKLSPVYPTKEGVIGVKLSIEEINTTVQSPGDAVVKSWNYLHRNAAYMVKGLWMIVTGQIPLNDLHGIVAVTKIGSDIIEQKGIWDGLLLTALISIDLAIVNLLPIPALDGGHIMFLMIEKLRGRPVEEKTQEAFAKYGFAFLIGLMVIIIFNDIFALITDKL
ncbi:MAG: hypothetical protein A2Y25_10700 [Candidatus Melainabacteria bacterium GWF2_37_15]|nr:MAG: hypothetical protein A2Y25_10700 [Candidatus Melainabacteria bacterium GWF2_37_15]